MTKYEVMFIVKSTLDEQSLNKEVKAIQSIVTSKKGEIIDFKDMGRKKFAYPINKEISGFYYLINLEATKEAREELDRKLRINENIIRHLILNKERE